MKWEEEFIYTLYRLFTCKGTTLHECKWVSMPTCWDQKKLVSEHMQRVTWQMEEDCFGGEENRKKEITFCSLGCTQMISCSFSSPRSQNTVPFVLMERAAFSWEMSLFSLLRERARLLWEQLVGWREWVATKMGGDRMRREQVPRETAGAPISGVAAGKGTLNQWQRAGFWVLFQRRIPKRTEAQSWDTGPVPGWRALPKPKERSFYMVHNVHIMFCLYVCIRYCLLILALLLHV